MFRKKDRITINNSLNRIEDTYRDIFDILSEYPNQDAKATSMAQCMLSILDSLKLHDKGLLILDGETLSEVMFRKMKAYGIDLNKELGVSHLAPISSVKKRSRRDDCNSDFCIKYGDPYPNCGDCHHKITR